METGAAKQDIDVRSGANSPSIEALRFQLANDDELRGLSLYEKKAALVNRELDSHGMGRYQWWIWGLCGFGYFLDLMWAQAFGLALGALEYEFGLNDPSQASQLGNLSTAFSAGLTAGAFCWGFLVDIIGRWWAFNGTCFIASVFGLGLGGSNSYNTLLVLTAFCGFGVGGNIPIDTTICLEFLPQNRRFLLVLLSLFQPIGVVVSSAIAYGFIPNYSCPDKTNCTRENNMGWRYYLFTLGAVTLFVFLLRFVVFNFRESPKYLLYRGKDEKAALVLKQIADFNHTTSNVTLEHFQAVTEEHAATGDGKLQLGAGDAQAQLSAGQRLKLEGKRIGTLFASKGLAYMTVLTWLTYMFDYLSFSAAGGFIPLILQAKGAQLGTSVSETYRNYVIIYLPGVLGALLGGVFYVIPGIGRKWGMIISAVLQGVSLFLFATATTEAAYIGFNVLEYFMQTMFNAILYAWTPEIFPAPVRGTACGLASFFGRIFGIVAPQIGAQIIARTTPDQTKPGYGEGALYFAGAAVFVSAVCILLMPQKRMGAKSY